MSHAKLGFLPLQTMPLLVLFQTMGFWPVLYLTACLTEIF